MELNKVAREQQIAVFGGSGSGKTVLLSSFYGTSQEPRFISKSLFNVVADDSAQGLRLHQNYLGMKRAGAVPPANRFKGESYSFSIKRKKSGASKAKKAGVAEDLRLIWHDYPGEWFEQEPSGDTEAQRRVETFKSLLGSDVALVLVDGQQLIENDGHEERYLKSLFSNLRNGLIKLRDDVVGDKGQLVTFPRIWVVALSKADLLPGMTVTDFRDLVIEKGGEDLVELGKTISEFAEAPEAMSIGEDFVVLSSAAFDAGSIDVEKRVGVDLILPLAAMLPFSRHIRWAARFAKGSKVAERLTHVAAPLAVTFLGKITLPGPLGLLQRVAGASALDKLADMSQGKVRSMHEQAKSRHDFLTALLSGFQLDLDAAEDKGVLSRSLK